jgi:hypothetical protein
VHLVPKDFGLEIFRWSDLQYFFYLPGKYIVFNFLEEQDLLNFHVIATIKYENNENSDVKKMISNLYFTPKESVELYLEMKNLSKVKEIKERIDKISPSNYFKNIIHITKSTSREYNNVLKQELMHWYDNYNGDLKLFDKLIDKFCNKIEKNKKQFQIGVKDISKTTFSRFNEEKIIEEPHLYLFFKKLEKIDYLPAIGFSFLRNEIEQYAKILCEYLEKLEKENLESEFTNYEKEFEKEEKRIQEEVEKLEKKKKSKLNEGEEKMDEKEEVDTTNRILEKKKKIMEKYTFGQSVTFLEEEETKWWLKKLQRKNEEYNSDHILIRALKRGIIYFNNKGIGIHHDGININYF